MTKQFMFMILYSIHKAVNSTILNPLLKEDKIQCLLVWNDYL